MAKNTGSGSRSGAVSGRTQVKNPTTGDYVKRDEDGSATGMGTFMDVKQDATKFKGVAVERDGRRKKSQAGSVAARSIANAVTPEGH